MMTETSKKADFNEGEEVFFVLKNASMCKVNAKEPTSFFLKGRVHNGNFLPQSEILGSEPLAHDGTKGWLELESGKFYTTQTPRSPKSPYVNGFMTDEGFVPDSKQIH